MKQLFTILMAAFTLSASAQLQSRLIAESEYYWDTASSAYYIQDTTTYFYTGSRPGKKYYQQNYSVMKCDSSIRYELQPNGNLEKAGGDKLLFDIRDNTTQWTYFYWDDIKQDWETLGRRKFTYTIDNDTASMVIENYNRANGWLPYARVNFSYNSSRQRTGELQEHWDMFSKTYTVTRRASYTYNTAGAITQELYEDYDAGTKSWIPGTKTTYAYAGNNLIEELSQLWNQTIGAWENQRRIYWGYSNNLADSMVAQEWLQNTWGDTYKSRNTYDGSGHIAYTDNYYKSGNPERTYNFYDANYNVIEYINVGSKGVGLFNDTANRQLYTYNQNDDLTEYHWESYGGSGVWTPLSGMMRYYYEGYWPASIQNTAMVSSTSIKLYPVPASGILNINALWNSSQPFTLSITDMQGRIVQQWTEQPCARYARSISIEGLRAGNYILKLTGSQEEASKLFVVQ